MNVDEAIEKRKSIRAFDSRPVPKDILEDIMTRSLRSPSWGNTQSWGFQLVGGEPLEAIRNESVDFFRKGVEAFPEIEMPKQWNEIQTERYQSVGKTIFDALGIERQDNQKRGEFYIEMFKFFGAPHMLFLHLRKDFNSYALLDCGLILQTIALLAVEQDLGTCIMAVAVQYPDVVRRHAGIPDDRTLVMGMAVGYPDLNHPVNSIRTRRGKPEEFIQWVGVD